MTTYAYQYTLPTYEYTGKAILCPVNPQYNPDNPLSSPVNVPAKCILAAPPVAGEHQIAIASGPNPLTDTWDLEDDYRGEYYYLQDGTKIYITELGVVPPEGTIQTDPPNEYYTEHDGVNWIYTDNASLQEKRCDEVDSLRDSKFYDAFTYNSIDWDVRPKDMMNILAREAYANHNIQGIGKIEIVSGGTTDIEMGQYLKGDTTGDVARIMAITKTDGDYSTGDAEATILLDEIGVFQASETLSAYSDRDCTVSIQSNIATVTETSEEKYPWSVKYQAWRDRDNIDRIFQTPGEFVAFALAVHDYINDIFLAAMAHKDAIRSLGTEEAINNYDITIGW